MTFRFTLTAPDNTSKIISEPGGWDTASIGLERHADFHTLIEYFKSSFQTYGSNGSEDGGRDTLLQWETTFGPDALIKVLAEIDPYDSGIFDTCYEGNLGISLFIESLDQDHLLQIVFSQKDFWAKFIARYDSKVDPQSNADLDGNVVTPINYKAIPLPSQKIIKSYQAYLKNNAVFQIFDIANIAFLIGFDVENVKEIEDQSSLKLTLINAGGDKSESGFIAGPEYYDKALPFWNLIDDGEIVIDNLRFTMSQSLVAGDPNYSPTGDFIRAKNGKFIAMTNVDFYIVVNSTTITQLSKTHRSIPHTYLRNDGATEDLFVNSDSPKVTDFYLPAGVSITVKKYDTVKIFGIYNDIFDFPWPAIRDGAVFMWGTDGWSHDSGYDQMRYGMGNYSKYRGGGTVHDDANAGPFAYGGIALTTNGHFPTSIDDAGGIGLPIKASQWWTVETPFNVVGGTVTLFEGDVITALVDNPGDNLTDWNVGVLTPYEGLEAFATKSTFFQGYYDPTITNTFPAHEQDGVTAIKGYDRWFITSLLTNLGGAYVDSTYIIQALFNAPGAIRAHWWISTRQYYEDYFLTDRQFQGNWDASVNLYPAFEADGASGILKDDIWIISVAGIFGGLGGRPCNIGDVIRANVNTPGQTNANWDLFTLSQWQLYAKANVKYYSGMQVTFNTTYIDTIGQGFLVHDLAAGILDRICGTHGLLNAPYLGNPYTSKPYVSVGCASLFAALKGLQVRGYDLIEKPFFQSMKEFFNGLNPIIPLMLGYDKIAGNDAIVIDDRANAYNPTMLVLLSNIQTIKRSYENDQQYSSVKVGHNKWQSQAATGIGTPSGIDDSQTIQTRNTIFKNIGNQISILSDWIAASLTFESTRRVTNKQSANYTYDNDVFILALKNNGDGTFKPELNENFSEIDNLTNPDTRYNTRLSTTRMFLRNLRYVSGCLQDYLTSFFRFASGEGNYKMASTITTSCPGDNTGVLITENMDVPVSNDPVHIAQLLEIEHYMDWADYKTIRDNRGNAIGISQTDLGHVPLFIKRLDYVIATGLVKISGWPKTKFTITVPDSFSSVGTDAFKYFETPYHETQFE